MNRRAVLRILAGTPIVQPVDLGRVPEVVMVTVSALDAASVMEHRDQIADALMQSLRENHPLLGALRAVV